MKVLKLLFPILFLIQLQVTAQEISAEMRQREKQQFLSLTDTLKLRKLANEFSGKSRNDLNHARKLAKENGIPLIIKLPNGNTMLLHGIKNGRPVFLISRNEIAAKTISTNKVQPGGALGYNLDGYGIRIGLWEAGGAPYPHYSFREGYNGIYHFNFVDSTGARPDSHATHVAGTIVADDDYPAAKGMAPKSFLDAYDANHDLAEMANANMTDPRVYLSNHSYGIEAGWTSLGNGKWLWNTDDSQSTDLAFKTYDDRAWQLDQLVNTAPLYTVVWAAGNERGQGPDKLENCYYWVNNKLTACTTLHPKNGASDKGYYTMSSETHAKNIITVGAVDDIPNGYTAPSDVKQITTSFSSWGPSADGRIKPDIVANGENLCSTGFIWDRGLRQDAFITMSGTSMAAPSVTGSIALLLQLYKNTHNGDYPRASTVKSIVIHTADEAGGSEGPDYKYGWGLMNTSKAAQLIQLDQIKPNTIQEVLLSNGQTYSLKLFSRGKGPIKVTIAWTDPAPANLQSDVLVNDLDLRIKDEKNTMYSPWVLNPGIPENPASKGDNTRDNVEQILINAPAAGYYTVTVNHKRTLSATQLFSIVIEGDSEPGCDVSIKQLDEAGLAFGEASYWTSAGTWQNVSPANTVSFAIGVQKFLASRDFKPLTTQKFNYWVDNPSNVQRFRNWDTVSVFAKTKEVIAQFKSAYNVTISNNFAEFPSKPGGINDSLWFKDPWLTDYDEQPYGLRNQGLQASFKRVSSPFNPKAETGDTYKGVFLNQMNNADNAFYSLRAQKSYSANLSLTGKTHTFYFQNWSSNGTDPLNQNIVAGNFYESPVVFRNGNAVIQANYKGTQLSNSSTAFSNTSQRKFIRTPDGSLHMVYESMGLVWYERSSDGGSTWVLMNNGKPLSTKPSKSPSIDYCGNSAEGAIGIVFQEDDNILGRKIKYYPVSYSNGIYSSFTLQDIDYVEEQDNSSFDAMPVIAFGSTSPYFLVVWKDMDGLMTKYFNGNNSILIQPLSSTSLISSVTDATSAHPFLVSNRLGNTIFHLAWDENTSSTTGTIRYCKLSAGTTVDVVGGSYNSNVSSGSGFAKNSMPGMIAALDNTVRMSWLGATTYGKKSALFRGMIGDGSWNSRFWSFGYGVTSQCINMGSDAYYILFCDYTSGSYRNQFTDSRTLSNIYTLNTTGKDIQLNNGAGETSRTMYAMSFSSQGSLPYTFTRSTNSIGSYYGLYKGNSIETSGRMVVLKKDSLAEYYFSLQDISLDGKPVKFMEVSDTIRIKDISSLNKYMITEPFTLTDNSKFLFNLNYGVTDSSKGLRALGKEGNISYSVDLLDEEGKVLQSLNLITFSKALFFKNKQSSFQVNMKGIGNKNVRMRLNTDVNFNAECFLVDSHSLPDENGRMYKAAETEMINYSGEKVIKEYAISRNYPNPFNPSTVIDYQVPKTSKVTLKIFDMLGKEVTTLVNEVKEMGRYSVKFDASVLPSGTYIYEIRANDFVKSGKMLLLK
ncbi:MAG: S8 family serine peptidase [Ignavibacteria bacterium]|jgi:subtilisin family serine protease|nr:S8 family serine peptidase [Ignavibacteria bacterium]